MSAPGFARAECEECFGTGNTIGSPGRILELREEREILEARLAEISADIDREVVGLLRAGVTGLAIAEVCGWSKQRVSQLRKRAMANAEPDLGPGEAEMALHRSQIASRGGKAAAIARRAKSDTASLLEAYGIGEGSRGDALRFIARATSDELRPRSREEAAAEWVALRDERRGLVSV